MKLNVCVSFLRIWNLVFHTEGKNKASGVREQSAEKEHQNLNRRGPCEKKRKKKKDVTKKFMISNPRQISL